mmetsp:Transcript_76617/g.248499  ORF Transcript_76617/g.248499 Transcript_76617/m.248499 type:complete len:206 (+) Transcript_76617:578-1195(+)
MRCRSQVAMPGTRASAGVTRNGSAGSMGATALLLDPALLSLELTARTQPPSSGTKRGVARGPAPPKGGLSTKASSGEARALRRRSVQTSLSRNLISYSVRGRMPGKSAAPPTKTTCLSKERTPSSSHRLVAKACSAHLTMSIGKLGCPGAFTKSSSGTKIRSSASSMDSSSSSGSSTRTLRTPKSSPSARRSTRAFRVPGAGGTT